MLPPALPAPPSQVWKLAIPKHRPWGQSGSQPWSCHPLTAPSPCCPPGQRCHGEEALDVPQQPEELPAELWDKHTLIKRQYEESPAVRQHSCTVAPAERSAAPRGQPRPRLTQTHTGRASVSPEPRARPESCARVATLVRSCGSPPCSDQLSCCPTGPRQGPSSYVLSEADASRRRQFLLPGPLLAQP